MIAEPISVSIDTDTLVVFEMGVPASVTTRLLPLFGTKKYCSRLASVTCVSETTAAAAWVTAAVPSIPRVTVHVFPAIAVTSSLSEPIATLKPGADGKPLVVATVSEVWPAVIAPVSAVVP